MEFEQSEYWNKVAEVKEFSHEIDYDFLSPLLDRESKILDYGCGYGRLTRQLSDRGYADVTGIDNSEGMIERAKRDFPRLNFRLQKERILDFPANCFDAVLLFAVLTCIPSDNDQIDLMSEIERVIKPGGLLYISDCLLNEDQRNIDRYNSTDYEPYGVFELPEGVILRHHSLDYLKHTLLNDFNIIYERVFDVRTMNGNTSKSVQLAAQYNSLSK